MSLFFVPQSNLQAEMEAEKQICHTKKRALQIATDELAKNHETIKQQERTVEKLRKGVEWRSLVMMRMSDELKIAPEGIKLN
jgi:spindle assembly abnormal protein 6